MLVLLNWRYYNGLPSLKETRFSSGRWSSIVLWRCRHRRWPLIRTCVDITTTTIQ